MYFICGQSYIKLKPKKIYLIRHGQTGHNHRGIVQGRYVNSKLSKKGFRQAAAFYDAYKHTPFQKIYTSTLQRTTQTVQSFIDDGISHEMLPGLDEICWGKSEGLFANGTDNKKYNEIIELWKEGEIDMKLDGGESPIEVHRRQEESMLHIVDQPEDLVLLCMHGRAMRIMLSWITGLHLKEMDNFDHDNLSLYILNYKGNDYTIEAFDKRDHLENKKD